MGNREKTPAAHERALQNTRKPMGKLGYSKASKSIGELGIDCPINPIGELGNTGVTAEWGTAPADWHLSATPGWHAEVRQQDGEYQLRMVPDVVPEPVGPGAWDGPFTTKPTAYPINGKDEEAVEIVGRDGAAFAVVFADDCGKGEAAGAKARATRIAEALNRDQHLFERRLADDLRYAELVDKAWDRLPTPRDKSGSPGPGSQRRVTRDQLAEAMLHSALLAIELGEGPDQ